jgi:antitoxin HicB
MNFTYPAKIEKDDWGYFLVTFRDLPYGSTDGKTIDEAKKQAADCLEEVIAGCISDEQDIPVPSPLENGEYPIRLSAQMAAKTALYIAVQKSDIRRSELARQLNLDEKEIRRMLDPMHATKLPRIEAALHALGYGLCVSMLEPAA